MQKERILIVEDDGLSARSISEQLRAQGYEIVGPVADGRQAVEYAKEERCDLILMDVKLRDNAMDGLEATHQIRSFSDVPIILITGFYDDEEILLRARRAGANSFMPKQGGNELLLEVNVQNVLQAHKARGLMERNRIIRHLTHDINNLLGVIGGLREAEDLLIADTVALARQSAVERGEFRFEQHDIGRVIRHGLLSMQVCLGCEAVVTLACSRSLPQVRVDVTMFRRILLNLVLNARKHGRADRISVRTLTRKESESSSRQFVAIEIADNGEGMSPEVLDVLRQGGEVPGREKGHGIGLQNVRHVIEQHNGKLEIESEQGHGSTFRVLLPAIDGTQPPPLASVLLVEDTTALRELYTNVLEREGCVVWAVGEVDDAERTFREHKGQIQVVCCDLNLGDYQDGIALWERFLSQKPSLRGIIMSGLLTQACQERHDVKLLQKPFAPNELLRVIQQLLHS